MVWQSGINLLFYIHIKASVCSYEIIYYVNEFQFFCMWILNEHLKFFFLFLFLFLAVKETLKEKKQKKQINNKLKLK